MYPRWGIYSDSAGFVLHFQELKIKREETRCPLEKIVSNSLLIVFEKLFLQLFSHYMTFTFFVIEMCDQIQNFMD